MSWNIPMNFAGVGAAVGGSTVEEGYYKGTVLSGELQPGDGSKRPQIAWKIQLEGTDTIRTWWVGVPQSEDDNVRAYWRSFAESCGYTAAQLDGAGQLNLQEGAFKGKSITFYYRPKNESLGQYERLSPLPPHVWTERKAKFEQSQGAANGSAQGGGGGTLGGGTLGGGNAGGGLGGGTLGGGGNTLGGGGSAAPNSNDLMAALGG